MDKSTGGGNKAYGAKTIDQFIIETDIIEPNVQDRAREALAKIPLLSKTIYALIKQGESSQEKLNNIIETFRIPKYIVNKHYIRVAMTINNLKLDLYH